MDAIEAVRQFSRFYTSWIGVLHEGLLGSDLSLTEARIIYELAQRPGLSASTLRDDLELDAGYISRLLKQLEGRGLVQRRPSTQDGRQHIIDLTADGQRMAADLAASSRYQIGEKLATLDEDARVRLVQAMAAVQDLLVERPPQRAPFILRPWRPGDLGWVLHRQMVLYQQEFGWDFRFEGLVAGILSDFVAQFDPKQEACWIAEKDGAIVGSVFIVKGDAEGVAKLRLLYVEASARGLGIGHHLVAETIRFARQAGYRRLTLWTNDVLTDARRLYEKAGFRMTKTWRHADFGPEMTGETWDLDL